MLQIFKDEAQWRRGENDLEYSSSNTLSRRLGKYVLREQFVPSSESRPRRWNQQCVTKHRPINTTLQVIPQKSQLIIQTKARI